MAYIPNEWKDQVVQRPKTYQMNNNDDGSVTLVNSFGLVTELGTPVNEDYMNHIEQGIAGTGVRKYSTSETYNEGEWVLSESDGKLYKSLVANNKNNPITDITKWVEIPIGSDPDLTDLSLDGLDKINQSKALETGSVSTDVDVYNDILKYTHSTFDLSKFKVVGSPTISADGIVSGFSDTNYLSINLTLTNKNKIFSQQQVIYKQINEIPQIIWSYYSTRLELTANSISFKWNNITILTTNLITTLKDDDIIDIRLLLNDNNKNTLIIDINGVNEINITNNTVLSDLSIPFILVGKYQQDDNYYWQGAINLKYFQIIKDGEIVVDGRKTAVDTIKAPNYTVVGSLTISEDGIASGFSGGAYIIPSLMPFSSNNWGFEATFIPQHNTVDDKYQCIFSINSNFTVQTNRYGTKISITLTDPDTQQQLFKITEIGNLNTNLINKLKVIYANQTFYSHINGELVYSTTVDLDNFKFSNNNQFIGYTPAPSFNRFYGSIDLNSVKFYSNGSLVYQPCLYIPYTKSITGAKIVDAQYRSRVQDVYEQYGTAMYYTIDEQNQNFTLPMGEVYGMISQNKQGLEELDATLTADILQAMPVGASIAYEGTTAPEGWFAENGLEVQKSEYPKLYAVVGDKYNLETTQEGYFRLPDTNISSRFYEGSTTPGTLKDAGLPNITGAFNANQLYDGASYGSGAFQAGGANRSGTPQSGADSSQAGFNFNASRSSSVYGKSSTVQPKSITKFFIIKHD